MNKYITENQLLGWKESLILNNQQSTIETSMGKIEESFDPKKRNQPKRLQFWKDEIKESLLYN